MHTSEPSVLQSSYKPLCMRSGRGHCRASSVGPISGCFPSRRQRRNVVGRACWCQGALAAACLHRTCLSCPGSNGHCWLCGAGAGGHPAPGAGRPAQVSARSTGRNLVHLISHKCMWRSPGPPPSITSLHRDAAASWADAWHPSCMLSHASPWRASPLFGQRRVLSTKRNTKDARRYEIQAENIKGGLKMIVSNEKGL